MAEKKIYRTIGGTIGNMELKYLSTGKALLAFGVGVNGDPTTDQYAWTNCKAWEQTAQDISEQCMKGDKILVNGPCDEFNGKWSLTVYDWAVIHRKKPDNPPSTRQPQRSEPSSDGPPDDDPSIPF